MPRAPAKPGAVVAVIAAHPDDEALGAGGAMALHAARGDSVHPVFLADGVGARGGDAAAAKRRESAAQRAAKALGAAEPRFLGLPDNRLDSVPLLEVVQRIEEIIREVQPSVVYTHHSGDLNIDHLVCNRAVLTACRPLPHCRVRRIYAMEIVSSTEWGIPVHSDAFVPTRFVDITTTLAVKQRAVEAYAEEMREFPHPRSYQLVDALARVRGATVGLQAAEAFVVLREIDT